MKLDKYYEALDCVFITFILALALALMTGVGFGLLYMSGVL